jgi:hypothetical protein
MESEIMINGTRYYSQEHFDNQINIVKEELKKEYDDKDADSLSSNQLKYFILDVCNVIGLVPFHKEYNLNNDLIEVKGLAKFKEVTEPITYYQIDSKTFKAESFKIMQSKYSIEFLEKARKVAKEFNCYSNKTYTTEPQFYLKWDEEKNEFSQDYPCLIKFDNLVFCLAPRVEEE